MTQAGARRGVLGVLLAALISLLVTPIPAFASQIGLLDSTWGNSGIVVRQDPAQFVARGVHVAASGNIFVFGSVSSQPAMEAFLPNGQVDTSFGIDGFWSFPADKYPADYSTGAINNVVVDDQNRIVVAGSIVYLAGTPNPQQDSVLYRLSPDGTFDSGFNSGNPLIVDINANWNEFNDVGLTSSGNIIAVGDDGNSATLAEVTPSGALNPAFGIGGIVVSTHGTNAFYRQLHVNSDDTFYVAGDSFVWGSLTYLDKYNPLGALDTSFGISGSVSTATTSDIHRVTDLIVRDQDITIVSTPDLYESPTTYPLVLRYLPTGELDIAFNPDGTAGYKLYDQLPQGTSAVGGSYTQDDDFGFTGSVTLEGTTSFYYSRILGNSELDTTFESSALIPGMYLLGEINGKTSNTAVSSTTLPNGNVLIFGNQPGDNSLNFYAVLLANVTFAEVTLPNTGNSTWGLMPFAFLGSMLIAGGLWLRRRRCETPLAPR